MGPAERKPDVLFFGFDDHATTFLVDRYPTFALGGPRLVNVLHHLLPRPGRCYKLGIALRKAIESYPEDLKVAIVGTGGLSHQMIGERAGFNNESWDLEFLDLIDRDPERLARMPR